MKARLVALALLVLAAATAAAQTPLPRVLGVDYTNAPSKTLHQFPPFLHWDLREFPGCIVPWTISPHTVEDLNGNGIANEPVDITLLITTAQAAFDRWQAVSPALISFAPSGSAPQPGGFAIDGYNTVGWGDGQHDDNQLVGFLANVAPHGHVVDDGANHILESQPNGDDVVSGHFIDDGGNGKCETWANTWSPLGPLYAVTGIFFNVKSGVIQEVDIVMRRNSGNLKWTYGPNVDAAQQEVDILGALTHEVGHFIGIAHPDSISFSFPDLADGETPTMAGGLFFPFEGNNFNRTLEDLDKDACNFLYCPDLGDAPDPCVAAGSFNVFPSLVHDPGKGRTLNAIKLDKPALGAEHMFGIKQRQPTRNWTYEWLAKEPAGDASTECEANLTDADPFDDGVAWMPNPPVWGRKMRVKEFIRYATDDLGHQHTYGLFPLYGNGWLDTNQNCIWEEHFMSVAKKPPALQGKNVSTWVAAFGEVQLPAVVNPDFPVWLRCRLDYGENVGVARNVDGALNLDKGAAQFGEDEDYKFYCTTRYDAQVLCNPTPFPMFGVAMVYVGPSGVSDVLVSRPSTESGIETGTAPPPVTTYNAPRDETRILCPAVTVIPPFTYFLTAKCRPNIGPHKVRSLSALPSEPPQTKLRSFFTDGVVTESTPPENVPASLRVPTVNCATSYLPGVASPGTVKVTVGTVDFENGGWISGPDTLTGEWDDTLRVSVAYRISPQLIPIENLYPGHPGYGALPLVPVGIGRVTPQDAFEFTLNVPGALALGQYIILEVHTTWSTNNVSNFELIEFDTPVGTPTGVDTPARPSTLSLGSYPNPFNPHTTVRYTLPGPAKVDLRVYDVAGSLVRTLVRGAAQPPGVFEVEWDGRNNRGARATSGVYFVVLSAAGETRSYKMVLLK